jgi:putative flippase GtrA
MFSLPAARGGRCDVNLVGQFMGREAGPVVQFLKYSISGGLATATHVLLFHLLAWGLLPALQENDWAVKWFKLRVAPEDDVTRSRNSMFDNGIAFVFSNLVAYLLNILWVFEPGRHFWLVEVGLFYLVSGVSIVIGTALMGWLIRRYGIRTTYAFLSNLVTALLINYAMRKFVIFKG